MPDVTIEESIWTNILIWKNLVLQELSDAMKKSHEAINVKKIRTWNNENINKAIWKDPA